MAVEQHHTKREIAHKEIEMNNEIEMNKKIPDLFTAKREAEVIGLIDMCLPRNRGPFTRRDAVTSSNDAPASML